MYARTLLTLILIKCMSFVITFLAHAPVVVVLYF